MFFRPAQNRTDFSANLRATLFCASYDGIAERQNRARHVQTGLLNTLSDEEDRVDLGGEIHYELSITNNGPHPATGVVLTQTLPDSVLFASGSPGCTSLGDTVTCDVGIINVGEVIDLSIVVTNTESGRLFSTASVSSATTDPDIAGDRVA